MARVYLCLSAYLTEVFGKFRVNGYIVKVYSPVAADTLHGACLKASAVREAVGFGDTKILELHTKSFP